MGCVEKFSLYSTGTDPGLGRQREEIPLTWGGLRVREKGGGSLAWRMGRSIDGGAAGPWPELGNGRIVVIFC